MATFRVLEVVTEPPEFGYFTSVNPLVPFDEIRKSFYGPRVHSSIRYDSSRPEGFQEYEIETPYSTIRVIDKGLEEFP